MGMRDGGVCETSVIVASSAGVENLGLGISVSFPDGFLSKNGDSVGGEYIMRIS